MTVQIPAFVDDGTYPFWNLRMALGAVANPGPVDPASELSVSPGSGLQVAISPGRAWVQQTVSTDGGGATIYQDGMYFVVNDSAANPANSILAPVSNPRVDMVVLRVYDVKEQGLSGASKAQFEWVEGTETSGATLSNLSGVGTLPANSLLLDYVLQTVGESSISSGNILRDPFMGGWRPLTLGSGVSAAETDVPSARREGAILRLKGAVSGDVGAGSTWFTLSDSSLYPSVTRSGSIMWVASAVDYIGYYTLTTSGVFSIDRTPSGTASTVYLNGITIPL